MRNKTSFLCAIVIIQTLGGEYLYAGEGTAMEVLLSLSHPSDRRGLASLEQGIPPPTTSKITVIGQRSILESPPQERSPQLSSDHIVVIALDVDGREITRLNVLDPRLIRAEVPGPSVNLSAQVIYREYVEFKIALPDEPALRQLKFFKPEWMGAKFNLHLIGEANLP